MQLPLKLLERNLYEITEEDPKNAKNDQIYGIWRSVWENLSWYIFYYMKSVILTDPLRGRGQVFWKFSATDFLTPFLQKMDYTYVKKAI